jgi:hypothetical protein
MRVGVLIFLSICTSLPWTTGEIMPDFFAPLLVLAIYLLVVKSENLRRWDRLLLLAFLVAAQASHFSHIALAIGTSGVIAALSLLMRLRICWRTFLLNVAATCVAIAAILAINFAERKEVVLTPWSGILLLGKEMEYGTAQDYLARACPTRAYRICPYRDALPHDVPTFLYGDHSVLNDLGGGEAYRDEAGRLAMDIFKDAPLRHALLALKATSAMFLYFPTGWGNDPEPDNAVTQAIHRYFGRERSSYDTSRQQTGRLHQPFFNAFQIPVGFLLLAGNVLLLAISIVRRDREMILLLSVILAAMLGNAFLCGGLSSSDGRYQSRMIPLLVLGIVPFLFNAKLRERPLP